MRSARAPAWSQRTSRDRHDVSLRNIRSYASSSSSCSPGSCSPSGRTAPARRTCSSRCTSGRRASRRARATDAQLVRFGERAGRVALRGRRGETRARARGDARGRRGKRAKLNGGPLRAAELLARRGVDARVHTRPARGRQGRAGGPSRVLRPRARPAVSRALGLSAEYAAAVAQRNAALRRVSQGLSSQDAVEPWTEQVAALGTELVAARTAGAGGARARVRASRRRARARARATRLRGRAVDARGAGGALRRTSSAGRRASARTSTTSRSSPATRDLRSFGSQGEQRLAVLALLLAEARAARRARGGSAAAAARRRALRARPGAAARTLARVLPEGGQTLITVDVGRGAAARAGPAARGLARRGAGGVKRLSDEVARELGRFGPVGADDAASSRRGPAPSDRRSRGTPGRRGSRATARCTSRRARRRGRSSSASSAPTCFASCATPSARTRRSSCASRRHRCPSPDATTIPTRRRARSPNRPPNEVRRGAELAAPIEHDELREMVARAAAHEPLRAPGTTARSDTLERARKAANLQGFFYG